MVFAYWREYRRVSLSHRREVGGIMRERGTNEERKKASALFVTSEISVGEACRS